MTTYLVTGATGFVGAALTRRLLPLGQVRVLVRNAADLQTWNDAGARAQVVSLADPNAIAREAQGVDVVFHCAGESSHRAAPEALAWINVAGTENVLSAARHAAVRRVVLLSCADATLANRDRLNWRESQSLLGQPMDACARSKLLAEELALGCNHAGLQVTALRPAWVWGPGERHDLPALCEEGLHGRVSLCGSGENLVSAVYIDNLVDAIVAAGSAEKAPGHAYHVVDGENWTARELYTQLCAALGLPAPTRGIYALSYARAWLRERTDSRGLWPSDVVRRGRGCLLDAMAAAQDLDYTPKVTTAEGMQRLADWAKSVGGPAAIARTARAPATAATALELQRVADASVRS